MCNIHNEVLPGDGVKLELETKVSETLFDHHHYYCK